MILCVCEARVCGSHSLRLTFSALRRQRRFEEY